MDLSNATYYTPDHVHNVVRVGRFGFVPLVCLLETTPGRSLTAFIHVRHMAALSHVTFARAPTSLTSLS
jgi:hypothetical protein